MKRIVFCILLLISITDLFAQKVFVTKNRYEADLVVKVTNNQYEADYWIYVTKSEYEVPKSNDEQYGSIWYFTDSRFSCDRKIFFTDDEFEYDVKIYYVKNKFEAKKR